nr:HAD family hydrolase [uncultured Blautia sp.]
MSVRVLFTDLDGTLLNDAKEVTPGNQAAIDEALAKGHKIVVCTGRPLASARVCAAKAGLDKEGCYVICFNGGQIYNPYHEKTVYGKTFPKEIAVKIINEALKRDLHIQGYNDTEILAVRDTEELRKYSAVNHLPYKIVASAEEVVLQDPYKLIAISSSEAEERAKNLRFQREVIEPLAGEVHSFFSNDRYQEIVPEGISKGFAVRWFCDYVDVPIENSVAAGDAQNDIEMLKAAHVGAVMCNAYPGIAEYGNYVTEHDNNHDGVAEIIRKFILKED